MQDHRWRCLDLREEWGEEVKVCTALKKVGHPKTGAAMAELPPEFPSASLNPDNEAEWTLELPHPANQLPRYPLPHLERCCSSNPFHNVARNGKCASRRFLRHMVGVGNRRACFLVATFLGGEGRLKYFLSHARASCSPLCHLPSTRPDWLVCSH